MPDFQPPPRIENPTLDDYLEVMSKVVFQTGISWRVVESKRPETREAFDGFAIKSVAGYGPDEFEKLAEDRRVIRNRRKLEAISSNAAKILELDADHGAFKNYLRSHAGFEALVKHVQAVQIPRRYRLPLLSLRRWGGGAAPRLARLAPGILRALRSPTAAGDIALGF